MFVPRNNIKVCINQDQNLVINQNLLIYQGLKPVLEFNLELRKLGDFMNYYSYFKCSVGYNLGNTFREIRVGE